MLHVVTDRSDVRRAQRQLRRNFIQDAIRFPNRSISFRPKVVTADVYWHPELAVWGSLNDTPRSVEEDAERFWNVFGIKDPHNHGSLLITCEINPPHERVNRRVEGVFAVDDKSQLLLLHRGKFNRKGMTRAFFFREFKGRPTSVDDGSGIVPCAVVADIGSDNLRSDLARFVREVARIKSLVA